MIRNGFLPALIGLLLGTAAYAELPMVKEVEVTIDLPAVTNPAAALRYANIAVELQAAIVAQLTDRLADEGMRVTVDLSEFELSNSYQETLGLADTRLVGTVKVSDEGDANNFKAFEVTVNIDQARTFFPATIDMTTLTAGSDEFYASMVTAFATAVVEHIDKE